jgi:DNA repair ATPase RecN
VGIGVTDQLFNIEKNLHNARVEMEKDYKTAQDQQAAFLSLWNQRLKLEQETQILNAVQAQLPPLELELQRISSLSSDYQIKIQALKTVATEMARKINQVVAAANTVTDLAWTQNEIANGLMNIARLSLIDEKLRDEVIAVRDEVIRAYQGKLLPEEAETARKSIDEKLQLKFITL